MHEVDTSEVLEGVLVHRVDVVGDVAAVLDGGDPEGGDLLGEFGALGVDGLLLLDLELVCERGGERWEGGGETEREGKEEGRSWGEQEIGKDGQHYGAEFRQEAAASHRSPRSPAGAARC